MNVAREHESVLLEESLQGLAIKESGIYVDGTFGRGGHSAAILSRLGPAGHLLALDKDPAAIAAAQQAPFKDPRFSIVHASFSGLTEAVAARGWLGQVDGLLLDLGVSSPQLDTPERGFSFNQDGPLDMRMDTTKGMSAAAWLNQAPLADIQRVLHEYGEERFARRIAQAIVTARQEAPITTTLALSDIIKKAHPAWERRIHPATRSFQGIRIFINQELAELSAVLAQSVAVLAPRGRLCVISFHSLEDRLVKQFIQRESGHAEDAIRLPIPMHEVPRSLQKVGGLIRPSEAEIQRNPRARSARLRVVEKLA